MLISKKIMPNLNQINQSLTNLELLTELQKRIKAGSIEVKTTSQVKTDPLTSLLFKVSHQQVKEEEAVETNSTNWFSQNTWLWVALAALIVLLVWKKSFTVKTSTDLIDKSPSSQLKPN